MGVVFDEVVGTVDPPPRRAAQENSEPRSEPQPCRECELRRTQGNLERRAARLHAD